MIYIYRRQPSQGAVALAQALGGLKVSRPRAFRHPVVCWGDYLEGLERALNNRPLQDKFADALKLAEKGIPTIEVSKEKPKETDEPSLHLIAIDGHTEVRRQNIPELIAHLQQWLADNPEPSVYLGRTKHHIGGMDLLHPPESPDFYVKRLDLVNEFRVHSFLGASIRAGKKVQIEDRPVHPEGPPPAFPIRSLLNGWKISYDGRSVRQAHRDLAHAAVEALELDFGAVDLAETRDGRLIVLEVNRAPGLEGGTIDAYARAIEKWAQA